MSSDEGLYSGSQYHKMVDTEYLGRKYTKLYTEKQQQRNNNDKAHKALTVCTVNKLYIAITLEQSMTDLNWPRCTALTQT